VKISINRESPVPIRDQLIEQIALQIASGLLKGDEKLPSIRALAQRLGIHYNTVSSAYNHLGDAGLLDVRQGSGVRVASKMRRRELELQKTELDDLLRDFLAVAAEHGYSRQELQQSVSRVLGSKPIARILLVDRNADFHPLLLAEIKPHFDLPVEAITVEELTNKRELLEDSLVVTSLYHVFALHGLQIDPTRLVVCNVEPARSEMEMVTTLPSGSLVMLVSVSPTLLKMATNLMAALRGEDVAVRGIETKDSHELVYSAQYANLVLSDFPSEQIVTPLIKKIPVRVFHLYSESTIKLIGERLQRWG
jgi:GntR family transcriptional regulator